MSGPARRSPRAGPKTTLASLARVRLVARDAPGRSTATPSRRAGSSRSDKSGAPFSSRPSTPTVSLGGSRPASRTSPVGVAAGGRGLRAVRRRRDHPGPGPDRIRRTCTADALYGTRVLVETSMGPSATDCRCGGIPYLGAFDDPSAQDYLVLRRAGPLGAAHGRQVPPPPEAMEPWRVCPRQVLSGVGALMGTPKSRGT